MKTINPISKLRNTALSVSPIIAGLLISSIAMAQVDRSRPPANNSGSAAPRSSGSTTNTRPPRSTSSGTNSSPPRSSGSGAASSSARSSGSGSSSGSPRYSGSGSSGQSSGRTPSIGSGGSTSRTGSFDPGNSRIETSRGRSSTDNTRVNGSSQDRFKRSKEGTDSKNPMGTVPRSSGSYFPYFPGGGYYDPYYGGGYPSYPYPNSYPYPDSYPGPGRSAPVDRRIPSLYFYCEDFSSSQYISSAMTINAAPKKLFVPIPVYHDREISAWKELGADSYEKDRNADSNDYRISEPENSSDSALREAINDIKESWSKRSMEPLTKHLNRDSRVAVVLKGRYAYSLEAGDYLDLTNSALMSVSTADFVIDHIHPRSKDVYAVTGRHLYRDINRQDRATYFTYVIVKTGHEYIIAQVGSSPDKESL